eukprot:Amastigsp_a1004_210.p4 type:complete len:105 gc:universal Amastigsp_a1004_210:639-953(+)
MDAHVDSPCHPPEHLCHSKPLCRHVLVPPPLDPYLCQRHHGVHLRVPFRQNAAYSALAKEDVGGLCRGRPLDSGVGLVVCGAACVERHRPLPQRRVHVHAQPGL